LTLDRSYVASLHTPGSAGGFYSGFYSGASAPPPPPPPPSSTGGGSFSFSQPPRTGLYTRSGQEAKLYSLARKWLLVDTQACDTLHAHCIDEGKGEG